MILAFAMALQMESFFVICLHSGAQNHYNTLLFKRRSYNATLDFASSLKRTKRFKNKAEYFIIFPEGIPRNAFISNSRKNKEVSIGDSNSRDGIAHNKCFSNVHRNGIGNIE